MPFEKNSYDAFWSTLCLVCKGLKLKNSFPFLSYNVKFLMSNFYHILYSYSVKHFVVFYLHILKS